VEAVVVEVTLNQVEMETVELVVLELLFSNTHQVTQLQLELV
jgi:hypothetical protein